MALCAAAATRRCSRGSGGAHISSWLRVASGTRSSSSRAAADGEQHSPPPRSLPLPDLAASITPDVCGQLRRHGYAVVDGVVGETWCHLLRDDVITLAERQQLARNATHLVRPDGSTNLLAKHHIFEAEITSEQAELCPRLVQLWKDPRLMERLSEGLLQQSGALARQTLKVQLNAGGGACFPLHYDSDRALDPRVLTAIVYLNPTWAEGDGGQLQLLPSPGVAPPLSIEPLFGRMVLFSSQDLLHRVLPSASLRMCLTLWFYGHVEESSERRRPHRRQRSPPRGENNHSPALRHPKGCTHGGGGGDGDHSTGGAAAAAAAVSELRWLLRSAGPDERKMLARYLVATEWATSIEESHAPSPERGAALAAHWADVGNIETALSQRLAAAAAEVRGAAAAAAPDGNSDGGVAAARERLTSWQNADTKLSLLWQDADTYEGESDWFNTQ